MRRLLPVVALFAGCQSERTAPAPSPAPPAPSVAPSVAPSASAAADELGLGSLGGSKRPCSPLDQLLDRNGCGAAPAELKLPFPAEWNEKPLLPSCALGGRKVVHVRLQPGPSDFAVGGERCARAFSVSINGKPAGKEVCNSACGPYGFDGTLLGDPQRIAFDCWADLEQHEGLISLQQGALLIEHWEKSGPGGMPPRLSRQAYALPCQARVELDVKPESSIPH